MRHNSTNKGKPSAKGATPLQPTSPMLPEGLVRKTWLHYFNDYLRDKHVITEDEWRKMRRRIDRT